MKDHPLYPFITHSLFELEPLTGIRQLYFLSQDPEGEKKIDVLVRGILHTCDQFPYIPDEAKKKIIRERMIEDQDFDAFNSRTVYKWLNSAKEVYWAKKAEERTETTYEPLSPETEKMIAEHLKSLEAQLRAEKRVAISGAKLKEEMSKITQEDEERRNGSNLAKFQTSEIEAEKKALHAQWIKENYDVITGKPLETWMPEDEWIALNL